MLRIYNVVKGWKMFVCASMMPSDSLWDVTHTYGTFIVCVVSLYPFFDIIKFHSILVFVSIH